MPDFTFEREVRTPFSESYAVHELGVETARVDIHFTGTGMVHATLCVPSSYDEDRIEDLIAEVDERLVLPADPFRDDFIVTVWRGERAGVYSEENDDDDEETNGASPRG